MKTQMKERKASVQEAITATRKELRKADKSNMYAKVNMLENEIDRLEKRKSFYSARYEPVQFANGFVLNGKLLKQFTKKLPKMMVLEADFTDERTLEIRHSNGKLTLLDLREFYVGFRMPKGEELLDELGISLG